MSPTAPEVGPLTSRFGPVDAAAGADDLEGCLIRTAEGGHDAFALLYDRSAPLLFGVVFRVLRNRSMAEEVTQDVFTEIWRLSPRFDPGRGSAKAWMVSIAHRRAVDRVRSEEAKRDRERRQQAKVEPPHDTVVDEVVTRIDHERVGRALAQLNQAQREAVVLAFYGGHTYTAVAAILGQPEGTVKGRIRDGLRQIRRFLEVTA